MCLNPILGWSFDGTQACLSDSFCKRIFHWIIRKQARELGWMMQHPKVAWCTFILTNYSQSIYIYIYIIHIQSCPLVQSTASQVICNNDICYGIKYKLDVVGISCTGLMTVDFFVRALVLCLELSLNISRSLLVSLLAWKTNMNAV